MPKRAVRALVRALSHPSKDVRANAALSLGRLRELPQIAVPALKSAVANAVNKFYSSLVFALVAFGPENVATPPRPDLGMVFDYVSGLWQKDTNECFNVGALIDWVLPSRR